VPGLNHLKAVDPAAFANLLSDEISHWMVDAGHTPLIDFLYEALSKHLTH